MKAYFICDDIRKELGKNDFTSYEFCWERDKQARRRIEQYRKKGYRAKIVKQNNFYLDIVKEK